MSFEPSWDELQALGAVLETGSLSAGARRLGLTQPTMRNRIDALERRLGTVLFTRSAAGLVPTEQALALAHHVKTMAAASDAVVRAASGAPGRISGTVRVSVSEFVSGAVIPPMIVTLRERHPGLAIEIVPSNESTDLHAQQADIAVRMYPPRQDGLVARKAGSIELGFFAHRAYVERRGVPQTLSETMAHDLVGPDRSAPDLEFARKLDPAFDRESFTVRSDNHLVQFAAIRAGAGIGVVQVPAGNADPDLLRVLPGLVVASLDAWIVVHRDMRRLPKVRAAADHLFDAFARYSRSG